MQVVVHKYYAARGKGGLGKVAAVGKTLGHIKYIQHRPGEDREPGGREMFNDKEDRVDGRAMRQSVREIGNAKVVAHKLTLSPEVTPEDRKAFTRDVMHDLSRHKGLDLDWYAVAHNNTDHPHIHVVVLGKDRNGSEVSLNLKDIEKAKEFGDRYLERHHPREFERAREERERAERERLELRKQGREERIREGLELPWMKRNIVREQLEPYKEWKERKDQEREERPQKREEIERPYHQDTIEAAGRQWSRASSLGELRELNEHLWDNYEDRVSKEDYKKLGGWIRDKEQAKRDGRDRDTEREEKDSFEHNGKRYKSRDSYEKLTELAKELREKKERLPFDDYQNLRSWIEDRDRARFAGAMDKAMEEAIKRTERSKTHEDLKQQEGGRVIDPVQDELMRNPVVGLFMKGASIANEVVRSITLDDRNRDPLKENRQDLEKTRTDLDKEPRGRDGLDELLGERFGRDEHEQRERQRESVEKAIERNEAAQKKRDRKAREKREQKEREDRDRENFERGGWGR